MGKFKEIVARAIENGWLKDKAPKVMENQMPPGKSTRLIEIIFRKGTPSTGFGKHFSISDLLFNHEFTEPLFGKELARLPGTAHPVLGPSYRERYLKVMSEIALYETDEQRIDYVFDLITKKDEEKTDVKKE